MSWLKKVNKVLSIGVRKEYTKKQVEKVKLINGISLVGVPVSVFYFPIFLIQGYYLQSAVFAFGIILFSITLLFNSYFGYAIARNYVSIAAPLCFGLVNAICGKDAGFYMGFIVTTIPFMLIYDKMRQSILFISISMFILALSLFSMRFFKPISDLQFAMTLNLINLITVIMASLTVVYLFKKELTESRNRLEEKQKEIVDSIHYANRIQRTLLTSERYIKKSIDKLKNEDP